MPNNILPNFLTGHAVYHGLLTHRLVRHGSALQLMVETF
jgi:hypothetical protein